MQKARCGNPDLGTQDSIGHPVNVDKPESLSIKVQGRSGKASTATKKWPRTHLKWFIEKYPEHQKYLTSKDQLHRIINQSFYDWEKHSGLTFEMAKTNEMADFKIKFHSKDHNDGYPFDGPGATLAHAFYPTIGNIHFDDDEHFTDDYEYNDEQYTLRLVAAHEIGHALGLSHSFENGSLMYPMYQQFDSNYDLSSDDQKDIQILYGKPKIRSVNEQPKTNFSSPSVAPDYALNILPMDYWCSGDFQTGCEGPDGELYLFRDNQVWRYQARKKRSWDSQPTLISERFPSLNDEMVTACVKSSIGYTYVFRNYRMWQLKTHWSFDGPYILHGRNYPQNPHLALLHRNSIYLIRDRLAYHFNEFDVNRELEIRTINEILKPPPSEFIQAGFTYAKRHYIFTKNFVHVYDSTHGHLLPGYPKSKINGWFACQSTTLMPKWRKDTTSIDSTRKNNYEENENHRYFHHHHHHHYYYHHHRQRGPFRRRFRPHLYRRRWQY